MIIDKDKIQEASLQTAISKGLEFLYKNQLSYGEFNTFLFSYDAKGLLKNSEYISTTYITTFILYSLHFIKSSLVNEMIQKASAFLLEEMEPPGVWRFFSVNRSLRFRSGRIEKFSTAGVVPDLDDTACAAFCLKQNHIAFGDNEGIFLNNRDENGLFLTWLLDFPKRKEYDKRLFYFVPENNDFCCGVNANILLYLGQNEHTKSVCSYLNRLVAEDREKDCHLHFPRTEIFYYMLSRAYYNGVRSLEESRETVLHKLLLLFEKGDITRHNLLTAMFICTLINYNYKEGSFINSAAKLLVKAQKNNGAWEKEPFCSGRKLYYGSDELTTALCLEALERYSRL